MILQQTQRERAATLYHLPLLELIFQAAQLHREYHNPAEVQLCTLCSVKTGGCPEDCSYCSQSAHSHTPTQRSTLSPLDEVLAAARRAAESGSTRFCMGAAWRSVANGPEFDRVLSMVSAVSALGLEVCCTLGMLTSEQAKALKAAGLSAYNHNLDSSEDYYSKIVTTRTYADRLATIACVQQAGLSLCCGGIIGLGESEEDRIELLATLAGLSPHPESVPINALVPIEGTPLAGRKALHPFELARMIACARILMPRSHVRLSAGRLMLSQEAQALCFLAGANSIFTGDRLLTTGNPALDNDQALLAMLGLRGKPAHVEADINA